MKTKFKTITHGLYNFLADNLSEIKHHKIKPSKNPEHPAFYISLPWVNVKNKTWKMKEQHITIERDVDTKQDFLSPSHFTLCFEHTADARILYKIHVYFDNTANFNGTILKTTLTSDLEPLDLTDEDIRKLAQAGQHILFELIQLKANKFIEIVQKIEQVDHELQTQLHNPKEIKYNSDKYNTVQLITSDYIQLLLKHDRYQDDDIRDNWDYFYHLSDALKILEETPKRPHIQRTEPAPTERLNAVIETLETQPAIRNNLHEENEKEVIYTLLEQVKLGQGSKDIASLIQYSNNLEKLNQALVIYDLTHNDEAFVAQIKLELPKNVHDLASLFYESALEGDLETLQSIFENITLKINLLDLFEKVLFTIEMQPKHCDHLIPIANYFFEHSELYRSYVLFRFLHTHVDTPVYLANMRTATTVPLLKSNLLAQMFLKDHISAFALYLRHGLSPLGCHSWCGRAGFNALQTLLLLDYCKTNPEPYINLLFEHGAVMRTPKIQLPETYYTMHLSNQSASSTPEIFDKISLPSKKYPLLFTPKRTEQDISPEQHALMEELCNQEHILGLAWRLKSNKTSSPLNTIIKHCDIHSCFFELHQILKQNYFLVSLIPSRQGGLFFHPNASAYEQACRNREELKGDEDDEYLWAFDRNSIESSFSSFDRLADQKECSKTEVNKFMSGLFAKNAPQSVRVFTHHKTIAINIYPDPAYQSANDIATIQHHTDSAKIIYDALKSLYHQTTANIRTNIVQSMRKMAVEAQLKNDFLQASCYFQAGILAVSLHKTMDINDYKLLFSMLFQYGTCVDKLGSPLTGRNSVLNDVCQSSRYLFSKLSLKVKTELIQLSSGVQQMLNTGASTNPTLNQSP